MLFHGQEKRERRRRRLPDKLELTGLQSGLFRLCLCLMELSPLRNGPGLRDTPAQNFFCPHQFTSGALTDISIKLSGFLEAEPKRRRGARRATAGVALTLDVELHGGVGHPHHVLGDAGQLVAVVVSADVEEGQVDGVGGGLDVRLQQERRGHTHREDR